MVPRPLTERHRWWHRGWLIFSFLALVVLLAGCVSRSPVPTPTEPGDFAVLGKLAVNGAGEPFSARFRWDQQGADFIVELWGPFGQGRRRLAGSDGQLAILDGQDRVLSSGPAGLVMRQNLGFELPLDSLRYWIQGLPDPNLPVRSRESGDGSEEPVRFQQADWLIELLEQDLDGRPRRLRASGRGYEVRLALSRWLAPEAV